MVNVPAVHHDIKSEGLKLAALKNHSRAEYGAPLYEGLSTRFLHVLEEGKLRSMPWEKPDTEKDWIYNVPVLRVLIRFGFA